MSGRGRTRTIKGQATSQIPYQIGRFSRSWSGYIDGVWTTNWYPQDPIFYTPPSAQPQKSQVTYDEIHKGPPYREGGPFLSCKLTIDYPLRGIFVQGRSAITIGDTTAVLLRLIRLILDIPSAVLLLIRHS